MISCSGAHFTGLTFSIHRICCWASQVGGAGGPISVVLLWMYTFVSQVVLINLLIAMMTETYESVKGNADNEWRFVRVSAINEAAAAAPIPPPLSLPFLLVEICAS